MPHDAELRAELLPLSTEINRLRSIQATGQLDSQQLGVLRRAENRLMMIAYRLPGVPSPRPREENNARNHAGSTTRKGS